MTPQRCRRGRPERKILRFSARLGLEASHNVHDNISHILGSYKYKAVEGFIVGAFSGHFNRRYSIFSQLHKELHKGFPSRMVSGWIRYEKGSW